MATVVLVALLLGALSLAVAAWLGRGGSDAAASTNGFDAHYRATAAALAGLQYSYWAAATLLRWGALAAIAALGGGGLLAVLGRRLTGAAGGPLRPGRAQLAAFASATLLLAVLALATLPLAYGSGSQAERAFGLAAQSPIGWLADHVKRLMFWIPVTAALAAGFLACLARWPRRGWLAGAGAGIAIMIAGVFLAPRIVDPLFHDFTPLTDPALTREIRALGARAGLDINRVVVMDASRRTRRPNAYVTGLGATRQVVLYDTLLEQLPRGELRVVVAHELAHAARGHLRRGIGWAALGILAGAWALSGVARWQARIDPQLVGPGDPAGLPLLWLAFSLLLFATGPLQSSLSRGMEAEADWAALELTRDPAHYVAMQRGLSRANLEPVAPPGWIVTWLYTHPPIGERLAMASRWRAERAPPLSPP